jgi:hypothetical protein
VTVRKKSGRPPRRPRSSAPERPRVPYDASVSGPPRAVPRPLLPEAGSTLTPLKSAHTTRSLALTARPRTMLSASSSVGPFRVRACPRRLPLYHGRDAVVPFVTKQAAATYLRTLRQPCVFRRPYLPELAVRRHSPRHRGAPACAPFHARPSCPTPSLVPTEAHPTALSHGRASTSPEQAIPRLASGYAAEHHRRLTSAANNPRNGTLGEPTPLPRPFPAEPSLPLTKVELPPPAMAPGTQLQSKFSSLGPVCEIRGSVRKSVSSRFAESLKIRRNS